MMPRTAVVAACVAAAFGSASARPGEKGKKPILGWNTWCTEDSCGVDWCTSAEVLDVASTIKSSGLQAIGYDHINLDDCWGERDAKTNQIVGDPLRFPEGMKAFTAKLHAMGFKFGLYTDIGPKGCHHPFTGSYGYYAQDAATFKDWEVDYVKFDGCDQPAGHTSEELTCNMSQALLDTGRDFWFNFHCWHTETCAKCGTSYRVGPDHHDNWASTSGIINLLKTRQPFWGADPTYGWPDPDFIYTGGQGCENGRDPSDPSANETNPPGQRCPGQTEEEYLTEFSIWSIAGGEIIFSSDPRNMTAFQKKVWFNTEILAVYNDTSGFQAVKEVDDKSATFVFPDGDAHEAAACSLTKQVSSATCTLGTSFGCNDNKTMWTDGGCRGVFVCGGVEHVNCPIHEGSGRHECECKAGIKPAHKPGHPHAPVSVIPQVWMRPTSDGGAAVVLHNPHDKATADITVNFADVPKVGWSATDKLAVRDLWAHASAGSATGKYTAKAVPAHGSAFIKLTKA